MLVILSDVDLLYNADDNFVWLHGVNGSYLVKSGYKLVTGKGVGASLDQNRTCDLHSLWSTKIPFSFFTTRSKIPEL